MSKEKIFINETALRTETVKDPKKYLAQELREDISAFSPKEREVILRKLKNKTLADDNMEYVTIVDRWWREKYGFSFINKKAREEVLIRKYAPVVVAEERRNLQMELLEAIEKGDAKDILNVKEKYLNEFPDQLEGVEVLFGMRDFLLKQKEFEEVGRQWSFEKRKERFRDFTEYQFLFTHFIILNSDDKKFMDLFWRAASAIAERTDAIRIFNQLRKGQVSQVASYKVMESLGKHPKLSHPDEDAFNAVDLWTEGGEALQIKGWEEEVPAVIKSDVIAFPAIRTDEKRKTHLFNSVEYMKSKSVVFVSKIKNYGRTLGRDISGYMLVIPYSKIDFNTGEPAPELIEFFKKEIYKNSNEEKN